MTKMFSVVIPTYNRAECLKIALKSLASQTFRNFEVIVGDDGSTDHTKEVIDSFKDRLSVKYIWSENWGGPARPRNACIRQAAGEWICFLDSDDSWYPEKLECCLPYLDKSDVIYHNFDLVGDNVPLFQNQFVCRKVSNENAYMDLLLKWNGIANSGVIVRKSILDKVGSFDEDRSLIGIEDFDMWLRIAKLTNRFVLIPKVLGAYYLGATSFSKNIDISIERNFNLLEKYRRDLSDQQYFNVKALINFIGGIRYLSNADRRSANRYFSLVLFKKSNYFIKGKAIVCIILGKTIFHFQNYIIILNSIFLRNK